MPYVTRNSEGSVTGLYERRQTDSDDELSLDHPDVRKFLALAKNQLETSDVETIRVIEDLVDLLIQKKIIVLTDLPDAAQQKLMQRQRMRNELNVMGNLMVGEDDIL